MVYSCGVAIGQRSPAPFHHLCVRLGLHLRPFGIVHDTAIALGVWNVDETGRRVLELSCLGIPTMQLALLALRFLFLPRLRLLPAFVGIGVEQPLSPILTILSVRRGRHGGTELDDFTSPRGRSRSEMYTVPVPPFVYVVRQGDGIEPAAQQ